MNSCSHHWQDTEPSCSAGIPGTRLLSQSCLPFPAPEAASPPHPPCPSPRAPFHHQGRSQCQQKEEALKSLFFPGLIQVDILPSPAQPLGQKRLAKEDRRNVELRL